MNDKREALSMLEELLDDESDKMSAWEVEFIESLSGQRDEMGMDRSYWEPSDKQWAVLCRIWNKVFA